MHTWQRGFGSFGPMTKVSSRVSFYCFIIRSAVSLKNWVHSTVCIIELVTGSLEYLIDNPRMFNFGIDDLAEKPYIPQKNLLLWICCKCLVWWHRHTYFWPPLRLLEAKHHTATAHFGTVGWTEHCVKVPKCALAVLCLASNSLNGGQK